MSFRSASKQRAGCSSVGAWLGKWGVRVGRADWGKAGQIVDCATGSRYSLRYKKRSGPEMSFTDIGFVSLIVRDGCCSFELDEDGREAGPGWRFESLGRAVHFTILGGSWTRNVRHGHGIRSCGWHHGGGGRWRRARLGVGGVDAMFLREGVAGVPQDDCGFRDLHFRLLMVANHRSTRRKVESPLKPTKIQSMSYCDGTFRTFPGSGALPGGTGTAG